MARETQLAFTFRSHGGFRKKAGRKRRNESDPIHRKREPVDAKTPVHVTLKFIRQVPNLRTPKFIREFARAIKRAQSFGLRVQHFALESNHIHFIAEADSNHDITKGLISLKTSIAWAFKRIFLFHGRIFVGRYHMRALRTPTEMRRVLRYVLFNHAHHCKTEDFADVYSTVFAFRAVDVLIGKQLIGRPAYWQTEIANCLAEARSWMQAKGWMRGLSGRALAQQESLHV